jgi:hypothetical protein
MIRLLLSLILLFLAMGSLWAVPPLLNYAGQVSVDGQRFDGEAKLKFALVNPAGSVTYWSQDGTSENGSEPTGHVSAHIRGGLYSILIGNTAISGMGELDASVFQEHDDVHLRVWFSDGINGFERIAPDRPFAAVPYALSAGSADITPGSISLNMLDTEVQNSLSGTIPNDRLSTDVNNALKPLIAKQPSTVAAVGGSSTLLSVDATGVNNSYQWKKNGEDLEGATSRTLSITDLNASQHEGSYTVVVSNAFGSVTSSVAQIDVNGSLTEGLVGWWKFDETDGTVASDSSGNGNDGNLMGGPTWTSGKIGGALSFDGVNKYVDVGNSSMLNPSESMSITCWFLPSEISDYVYGTPLVTRYVAGTDFSRKSYFLNFSSLGEPQYYLYNGSSTTASAKSQIVLLSDQYYFIAVAYSTLGGSMYLNNVKVAELELGELTSIMQSSVSTRIGGWGHNDWPEFKGIIDEVRIYDRALSAFEVKALYELGEGPVQESGSGTTTVVNGTVADGSITANQLSEQILKYLKPEITQQPTTTTVFADTNHTISVSAEGKYLTYQWKKNGVNLAGETNATLTITDANITLHEGNYSVVVSNDFGSVESGVAEIQISEALMHGLIAWYPLDQNASDMSGRGNHGTLQNTPEFVTNNGKSYVVLEGSGQSTSDGDHILLPFDSFNSLTEISVNGWVNFLSNSYRSDDWAGLLILGEYYSGPFSVYIRSGQGTFVLGPKYGAFHLATESGWNSFTVSASSEKTNLYYNGEFKNMINTGYTSISGSVAAIGRHWWSSNTATRFGGFIDNIRIYNRALSAAEVQALYQLGQ